MDKYYLGIDGGGTKTAFVLIDAHRRTVYESAAGPSGLDTVSAERLHGLLAEQIGKIPHPIAAVFAGIGGIVCEADCEAVNRILSSLPALSGARIESANDVMSALYGGLSGRDGILLIAGTGSVAFGKFGGRTHRCGGYCYKEGDPGSAYFLGQRALTHYAGALDGRWPFDALAKRTAERIGCRDYASLAKFFAESDRTAVAAVAPAVTATADCPSSAAILREGIDSLSAMIGGVYRALGIDRDCDFCVVGSLGNLPLYREMLDERVRVEFPRLRSVSAERSPAYGAALRAMEIAERG